MDFQSPPPTTRRNPPRAAKSAAASSISQSHKKRLQSPKPRPLEEQQELPANSEQPQANSTHGSNLAEPVERSANATDRADAEAEHAAERASGLENSNNVANDNNNGGNNPAAKNLEVFLRIRPAKLKEMRRSGTAVSKGLNQKRKTQILRREEEPHVCLKANDSHSVTLTLPPSMLESKRAKTEVYTGFSHVFLPNSTQEDVYEIVMHPLIEDFMEGKSCLLVAMGPTSSGKTHTMFGNSTEPGLVPRTLKKLLASEKVNNLGISRSYFISMFEIYSERGRGEKIIDLFQGGSELSMHQSNMKGLQEVAITCVEEAESLLTKGMEKRTTAATNANSQSSRSQCIINLRSSPIVVEGQKTEGNVGEAVLTIADLAGAEREKKTGNQGIRFNESNFINNTSMVFGLCLRALLEHQKNPKRPLEKHYHNSLLTRYLKDYLEAKGRMVMVLNVSPEEENYVDTSFVLRQASPFVNIKFNIPCEEVPNVPRPKRPSSILSKGLLPKRKKLRCSQEILQFNLGKGLSNRKSLVRRTMAFGKDRNTFGRLSSVQAPDQHEKQTHAGESSSDLLCRKEQDEMNLEDSVAFDENRNSSGSLQFLDATDHGEEHTQTKSSSVLFFTEEQLKERISIEIERALNQEVKLRNEQLMTAYTDALSNVLKDHEVKVKKMEEDFKQLEKELKRERELSLELSNEVRMLKEHCAFVECENEKLKMIHKSGNTILNTESNNENSLPPSTPKFVGCQNDVTGGDCHSNTLTVIEGPTEMIVNNIQGGNAEPHEEAACKGKENNETVEASCKSFSSVDNKSGCSSCDVLCAVQSVNLHGSKISESCKDTVCLPGSLECKPPTILKCIETLPSLILEGCHNRDDMAAKDKVNTLSASVEACESLTEEMQGCVSGEANRVLKDDEDNLLQTNQKEDINTASGINPLEKFTVELVEVAEIDTSQDSNEIETCEGSNCLSGETGLISKEKEVSVHGMKEECSEISGSANCGADSRVNGLNITDTEPTNGVLEGKSSQFLTKGAKSNLKRGRMLASLLLNRKVDDSMGDINTKATENLEDTSESCTTAEDDVGPIGQCLEELLDISPSEIESGLWKGDIECKQKISDLLERHNGVLDLHSFKKGYSQQKSLCLRYCFSLICKKILNDKQWVSLSDDVNPKSRQKIFWAIVKAQTVAKAASHARQGLQKEGLFRNINHYCPSPEGSVDIQASQIISENSNHENFPSRALPLDAESLSVGEHLESLEGNKENLCSSAKSTRRKLLPASSLLVKGVDDEISKVNDRFSCKISSAERAVGTRGRMSLARMLASNQ